ncbi:MFS transporter [Allopusillimonas soli]|uniref:MFS transporter n=1 Tax=Allopusillimonas soli TaxID=659016 RepID=A0A853FDX4_9BURK|nr:MFS transporter [Allopusillimonas soli]NYT38137.1 MFS transporter [Allopusillimonas soli]
MTSMHQGRQGPLQNIASRLDDLTWSRWHTRVVLALGVAWMLDGLEVTLVGSFGSVLERPETLALSASEVGWAGSLYVGGAVLGALIFGRMADTLGRKRLFLATLTLYMAATLATGLSFDAWSFILCRFVTGLGIGGEYAAINSAIDELVPARVRGRVSLAINGSFWIGAALGAGLSLLLLNENWLAIAWSWRLGFIAGAVLALAMVLVRRHVPESPRWLATHGREDEALRIVADIEGAARRTAAHPPGADHPAGPPHSRPVPTVAAQRGKTGHSEAPALREVMWILLRVYRRRSLVALAMMVSQAFFYNAIFFTYAMVLTRFYNVPDTRVGLYIFPFALGNVLGPLMLGPLFDRVGRRKMIAATYVLAGLGLAFTGWAFLHGWLTARGLALCWSAVFFLASAAASSAYLTVSEVFPLEMRAVAISLFYAVGTGAGGFAGPALFGVLIQHGNAEAVAAGYLFAALLVIAAGVAALFYAVDAERRPLEDIAPPLAAMRASGCSHKE